MTLDYNPHAPQKPGYTGLQFDDYYPDVYVRRTFVRIESGRRLYLGQYQSEPGKALSTEVWHTVTPERSTAL
ncbi:hypothetical protein OH77DRAFT_1409104 [Trametes cingulata]|nr:hypothetical protein OH77DRAFT_1409104 [Trametes cingulata]